MEDLVKLERRVQSIYDETLRPLAEKFQYQSKLPTSGREAARRPCVLFLGNHSSGKSSFINYLIDAQVQKTGLAPTDDGFTIITYGEERDELDGQSVATHPDLAFRNLQTLGPEFLSRLRMKAHPHELLKSLTLVDSPGMIDASGTSNTRGYDFATSVRQFAEASDLILFFFDPDKPGTTGETISMFTQTLAGLDHKLLIIINKMDSFSNIRDFARTYGALCWNLSKMIKTKDMPQFFTTYLPGANPTLEQSRSHTIPLQDFDNSRDEVIYEIKRAPVRRADNLVSDLYNCGSRLSMVAKVCREAGRQYRSLQFKIRATATLVAILGAAATVLTFNSEDMNVSIIVALVTIAATFGVLFVGKFLLQRLRENFEDSDGITLVFKEIYRTQLAIADRADLRGLWDQVRSTVLDAVRILGPDNLPSNRSTKRLIDQLDTMIFDELPRLRRKIAGTSVSEDKPEPAPETAS